MPTARIRKLSAIPILVTQLFAFGGAQAAIPESISGAWVQACTGNEFASKRIATITQVEVEQALQTLIAADEVDALGKIATDEACLSLAATEATGRPVIVLQKDIQAGADIHEGLKRANPTQAKSMSLAYRLDNLGLDLHPRSVVKSEQYQEWHKADPDMALGIVNQGLAQMAQTESRSFTVVNQDAPTCLVVIEPQPIITNFLNLASPTLAQALTRNDRKWLGDYGDAVEFWHEVAHCQTPKEIAGQAAQEGINLVAADAEDNSSCSALESSASLTGELSEAQSIINKAAEQGKLFSSGNLASSAISSPTDDEAFGQVVDAGTLLEMSLEALMDVQGMKITAERFNLPESGCTSTDVSPHPWHKIRTLWSIGDPDARYMTWLTPWLKGQPHSIKRQILADAWGGLLQAKKSVAGTTFYRDWMLSRLAEQRRTGVLHTPALTPDADRKARWEHWLTEQTQPPSGVGQAVTASRR